MKWLRLSTFQTKTHYCTHCGYSFKKPWFSKIIHNPIYVIGFLNKEKTVTLFISKEDYDSYKGYSKKFVFTPLINSINLMK